jgi:homoserine O-acetyltransferase/O-succinyltransferase
MTTPDLFTGSTDGARSGKPLRHLQQLAIPGPFPLAGGGTLPLVTIAYETYGTLNEARDNAVLICHALSGDSHVARHDAEDDAGWWDCLVGPGRHVDTDRWFVICANVLGGCRGSTGPNAIDPRSGQPYGPDFPEIGMDDVVRTQVALIDHLGIGRLRAVVGGSMGGMQAMLWATLHAERVAAVAVLASAHRLGAQALAFDVVARNAILRDPDFAGGAYYGREHGPEVGLAIARMLGHITYLSRESMQDKFEADRHRPRPLDTAFEAEFSVGSYLAYQGERFVERFDANTYLRLSMAIDRFDLGSTPVALRDAVAAATCRWLVVSFSSDWLFPPQQSRDLVRALLAAGQRVSSCEIESRAGHDAFLLQAELDIYGPLVQAAIEGGRNAAMPRAIDALGHDPSAIFYQDRIDYDRICGLVKPGSSVLDLGCGTGGLLARLRDRGHTRLVGVELDRRQVVTAVGRGLDVVNADIEAGLAQFATGAFDVVVLSHTLQAVRGVESVLEEMLRVGRTAIVSFPNAAHRSHRRRLSELGRAPETTGLKRYHWYNTPDIRLVTMPDFEDLCELKGWRVLKRICLDIGCGSEPLGDPASEANIAVYALSL